MASREKAYRLTLLITVLVFMATSATAVDLVVDSGLDVWVTRDDGSTFFSFKKDPLPADFFCSGSEPFTDSIFLKGSPVATFPAGALGEADTILQRLDDAVFDENGVAATRLQMQALHFVGMELLDTVCGKYQVDVVLDGEQPITEMRIYREKTLAYRDGSQVASGTFAAEVGIRAKMVFTPVGHKAEVLEVPRSVTFPPKRTFIWSSRPERGSVTARYNGFVVVDTNADGTPDTYMPGTSRNFVAGAVRPGEEVTWLGNGKVDRMLPICGANCHCEGECANHCF
jgi:hypothetical protein